MDNITIENAISTLAGKMNVNDKDNAIFKLCIDLLNNQLILESKELKDTKNVVVTLSVEKADLTTQLSDTFAKLTEAETVLADPRIADTLATIKQEIIDAKTTELIITS